MREISSPLDGFLSPLGRLRSSAADFYAVAGFSPDLVFDFTEEYYRTNGSDTTFSEAINHSRAGNATMVDSDGVLKWAPHNLLSYSEQFDNAAWGKAPGVSVTANTDIAPDGTTTADTVTSGANQLTQSASCSISTTYTDSLYFKKTTGATYTPGMYLIFTGVTAIIYAVRLNTDTGEATAVTAGGFTAPAAFSVSDAGDYWRLEITGNSGNNTTVDLRLYPNLNAAGGAGAGSQIIWGAHLYRSDLGGMVDNPDRGDSYVPTTSSAVYLPRRGHHVYNGSEWVNEGLLVESEARTNLLHTTDALVTQSYTVTAEPHTLHFTGTGTVTLSGASTDGPLVGTGTGEENRVSLTFTPTAASLTLTVSGTVTDAQLEVGSTPSSYIPNLAGSGTVTRAADTLTVPAANLPYDSTNMSIQMQGRVTYADTGADEAQFVHWRDGSNWIFQILRAGGTYIGAALFDQNNAGVVDSVIESVPGSYSPGINVPYNIASRHGSTFINGAVDGTALTADTTPTALPDLENTDLELAYDYNGTIKLFRMWANDLADSGIEEASS